MWKKKQKLLGCSVIIIYLVCKWTDVSCQIIADNQIETSLSISEIGTTTGLDIQPIGTNTGIVNNNMLSVKPGTTTEELGTIAVQPIPAIIETPITRPEYIIGCLDQLEIKILDNPDLTQNLIVSPQGDISFPMIGRVYVAGLTPSEASTKIATLLEGYLVAPSVTVSVNQFTSKKIYLFGEVKQPGSFVFSGEITLLKAIATAGGFTEFANMRNIKVYRQKLQNNGYECINVNVKNILKGKLPDLLLKTGDVIMISESWF